MVHVVVQAPMYLRDLSAGPYYAFKMDMTGNMWCVQDGHETHGVMVFKMDMALCNAFKMDMLGCMWWSGSGSCDI